MKDQHTIQRCSLLHPKFRPLVEAAINEAEAELGITLRVVQGYRTFEEQAAIYNQGRTTPGQIVTYAPPGTSYHNYGLAVDIAPIIFDVAGNPKDLDWNYGFKNLDPFFSKQGCTWGGKFKHIDADHWENKFSLDWRQMLIMYNKKNFIPGTNYINI